MFGGGVRVRDCCLCLLCLVSVCLVAIYCIAWAAGAVVVVGGCRPQGACHHCMVYQGACHHCMVYQGACHHCMVYQGACHHCAGACATAGAS